MFERILVAYDGSPESERALRTGLHLAKTLNAELRLVSVQERQPLFATYAEVGAPGETVLLHEQISDYYRTLHASAQQTAREEGLVLTTEIVEGDAADAITDYVRRTRSDLLILGLHQHASLFSRLWHHTARDISQQVATSILGVH